VADYQYTEIAYVLNGDNIDAVAHAEELNQITNGNFKNDIEGVLDLIDEDLQESELEFVSKEFHDFIEEHYGFFRTTKIYPENAPPDAKEGNYIVIDNIDGHKVIKLNIQFVSKRQNDYIREVVEKYINHHFNVLALGVRNGFEQQCVKEMSIERIV